MSEPTLREQLLADYVERENAIDRAANAELWELADWLAEWVPPRHPGPSGDNQAGLVISLKDLAAVGRRGLAQLQNLRKTAIGTRKDRLPQITPTAYYEALRRTAWDLGKANARLIERGPRKRDQRDGPHESVAAIERELSKRSADDRAAVAAELMRDPTVADLIGDHDPASFGEEWADALVLRVNGNACKLTAHVKKHGLRFSPSSSLDGDNGWLYWLTDTEAQIAEVRAAVQERLTDERLEVQ